MRPKGNHTVHSKCMSPEHTSFTVIGRNSKIDMWFYIGVHSVAYRFQGHFDFGLSPQSSKNNRALSISICFGIVIPSSWSSIYCLRRFRRKHLCRNSDTLYLVVYLYNILLA